MKTEIKNRKFILFVIQAFVAVALLLGIMVSVNYHIDASGVIAADDVYVQMAELALDGNIVATSENYNERLYQVAIVDEMKELPQTIVIGSSRGMFLGEEITGYVNLYNNCVSGACLEDYYALLGLYDHKFSDFPSKVIMEISPWVFYKDNLEARWTEYQAYTLAAEDLYYKVNGRELAGSLEKENLYLSVSYFQYNFSVFMQKGLAAFAKREAKISTDFSEAADYPDGSIRYAAELENAGEKRLALVTATNGAVTYANVNEMMEIGTEKREEFENLLDFLINNNTEVLIYMQPFSVTQSHHIFDEHTNPVFEDVEEYLTNLGTGRGIKIIGSYDARKFDISDEYFIDYMHLDKAGTQIIWDASLD